MSYKRRPSWSSSYATKTLVSIHWSSKSSAFAIKFADTKNWNEMQILIGYLKNIPYGERDHDPENKIWYLIEKYIDAFKEMVGALSQFFDIDFIAKPTGQTNTSTFVPIDVYFDRFKQYTGTDIKNIEYGEAKKIYRRWLMKNHPDINPDKAVDVAEVNTAWSQLELNHYKTKKELEYAIS